MTTAKKKTRERKKPVTVYARFESKHGAHIETWKGSSRSMSVAMRRAILEIWRRPSITWKHYHRVSFTAQTMKEEQHAKP